MIIDLSALSVEERREAYDLLREKELRKKRNRLSGYKPYGKQQDFHAAGAQYRERLFMAANQSGKTYSGAFEVAMHATGRYPDWWAGVRFPRATRWMIGSESAELTRKGQQRLLLGPPEIREEWGTGAIPHECLVDTSLRAGVADAVASCIVKHVSGENSVIQFNSYDQGRMQRVDSPVLTPTGWARIGDLRVGDEIIAGDGTTTRVTGVFPHGVKELYELTFDSGVRTLAGAEHLWLAAPRTNGSFRVMSTQDMIDRYGDAGGRVSGNTQISTPTVGAVQFPHKDVPLDPYLVGALLGDGCMRGGRVRFTSADPEIAEHVRNGAEQVGAKMAQWTDIQYGFREAQRLHKHLEELGIAGRKAYEKHIPDIYLWNSPQIRLAVLQGLLDTDGSVSPRGTITFASTSQDLMRGLAFLVRSLGGKARVKETNSNRTRPLFRATLWLPGVQAFRLQRKLERCVRPERETSRHILRTIRKVDSAEAVCIAVEHESRLYVTDDFIVTHNTKWQADTVDGVWLDEEPPMPIYSEALTRTNATGGMVFVTFTPLMGMSDVVRRFLIDKPDGTTVINMTVHDVEHYSPEQRDAIIASYPEHERDARTKGIPSMGSGRVFPLADEAVAIAPFAVPPHWPRIVGLDFGIDHPTAAVWMAWDRDTDTLYVTDIYRVKDTSIVQHAAAIRTRGEWIPVAWPHDGLQRDKGSGQQLAAQYKAQGLSMLKDRATFDDGSNGLEAGVAEMLQRMQTRRLRVFSHLSEWFEEFRLYHRKDGLIVAKVDDLMAATRYGMMMRRFAKTQAEVAPRGFIPPVVPFGVFDEVAGY
jgi:phage terminase large subunit-like protein